MARKRAAITAKLRMMNVPDKKTGVGRSVVREQGEERADYSANVPRALRVPADDGGVRLDLGLAKLWPQHSRSRLQGWVRDGRVRIDGDVVREPKHKLWGGFSLTIKSGKTRSSLCHRNSEMWALFFRMVLCFPT